MRVGIISVFTDYHRRGKPHRGALQPQIGPLIAALLPPDVEVDVVNDTWDDPDWTRDYDLLFLSSLHSDFDRARQISHYWRRRGATTVIGGPMANMFPHLCSPFFDAVAQGDPEPLVAEICRDFRSHNLKPFYRAQPYRDDLVPLPRLDLVADHQVLPLSFEVTRGCPYTCDFCVLTGIGTRHHIRDAGVVGEQIDAARRMLRPLTPWYRRWIASLYDNNIGGNLGFLRRFCEEMRRRKVLWGGCVTFNVVADEANVALMARSGCRLVFVGLETFNPVALAGMRKHQNVLDETRRVVDLCRRYGILFTAGLMLSPTNDTVEYIDRIPQYLQECRIHVPTYICFETPFPGTPHFKRLAESDRPPLMPNTLLADLDAYTVATRPRHASPEEFVAAFRRTHKSVYHFGRRLGKVADDLPRFALVGSFGAIVLDLAETLFDTQPLPEDRSFIAGTDRSRPETVPLSDADFASEHERDSIMRPWAVADAEGRVLPHWLGAVRVYLPKGRIAPPSVRPNAPLVFPQTDEAVPVPTL